jgi:hypothetical protein
MIKNKIGIGAIFAAILLVSIAFIPAVSGKADGLSSVPSDQEGKKRH